MYRKLQVVLAIGVGLWLALGAQPPHAAAAEVTVMGVVYADEEDAAGNVRSVVIVTEDDDEFLVAPSGEGKKLLGHIESTVNATGAVSSSNGAQTIAVTKFEVIGED
jgi:hypothetical protein